MLWLKEMSSHLNGTSRSQFDTSYWYIFCTHPHCKAVQGTQLLLTQIRLLLGERWEELFNLIKTTFHHLLPLHENKTILLGQNKRDLYAACFFFFSPMRDALESSMLHYQYPECNYAVSYLPKFANSLSQGRLLFVFLNFSPYNFICSSSICSSWN